MIVLDNFLPKDYEEEIKINLYSGNFPWYFLEDITSPLANYKKPALTHTYYDNNTVNSNFFNLVSKIPFYAKKHLNDNFDINSIILSRSFLQFPTSISTVDEFHIDQLCPHTVFLYYVNDSDGDTIILDKKYNGEYQEEVFIEGNRILKKVTPKKGRLVIFDGYHYHSAEQPVKDNRCIINFNLI
jgi:hypothetical protein